ncbi:hypothetical protein N566_25345 [Streptomycetaceae bacterium MP113-05]|nr:hypothetical protein N566_25345 [Streptomycetaceae bacterium MP113-05]
MEALFLLIALAVLFGVVVVPAMRRRRLAREAAGGHLTAVSPEAAYGFVPVDELDVRLPGPDPQLVDALDEARVRQDWEKLAQLLALTGDEWELRWQRVQSAAGAAAKELAQARQATPSPDAAAGAGGDTVSFTKDPASAALPDARWLREWRAESPQDPSAVQVYAQFLVWQGLAEAPGTDAHRIILEEARTVCREAAALADADPTPYLSELLVARALGDRPADFEALWSEVVRRAPHHMGAHLAALTYWSENGCGSKKQADAFAQSAAAHAPQGSLLPALPLFALHEHLPEVNLVRGLYQSADVERAIEAAEFAVDQVEDDHPVRPHVLHLLFGMLVRAERYEEALQAVVVVDGYVGALPWALTADPAASYAAYRALAVAGWESSGGHSRSPLR